MRYKEYNVNRVLEKAIALFWRKGYNGCSINDLVEETGVNRFSLYHEFENKEGILYASLKLYRERYCDDKLAVLRSADSPDEVIGRFFLSFMEGLPMAGDYFIHIGTELADSDPRIRESLDLYLGEIRTIIRDLLIGADYSPSDAEFRARHLLGLFCTVMSFCLIHTREEREKYVANGINLILNKHAQTT